ncbi:hypothetical protein CSUI_001481 [Cystoisospora suis]|uniref:Uncharacterized protein n=1 Tax=Cystoisospora suis TaxID=483139 RepID=A0A2C6LC51_9APIC|nr:hypothetical protein CSUI_001481 [Cystoisospora suis]
MVAPFAVFVSGPKRSIATTSPGQPLGNVCIGNVRGPLLACCQHCTHVASTLFTSTSIEPQRYLSLSFASVFFLPKCPEYFPACILCITGVLR